MQRAENNQEYENLTKDEDDHTDEGFERGGKNVKERYRQRIRRVLRAAVQLYEPCPPPPTSHDEVPPFSMTELTKALSELKNKKAPDTRGLKAEMLKNGSVELKEAFQEKV